LRADAMRASLGQILFLVVDVVHSHAPLEMMAATPFTEREA
jgi:hypothetical protein